MASLEFEFTRRRTLFACLSIYVSFKQKKYLLLPLTLYLIYKSPTKRINDEISPIISQLLTQNKSSNKISKILKYIFYYFLSLFLLSILAKRPTINDALTQPKHARIESTKRKRLGITYYLEKDSPSDETFKALQSQGLTLFFHFTKKKIFHFIPTKAIL